jgi:hypothetical protein
MAQTRGGRSVLATLVGYLLVVVVAYFVLRLVVGTIFSLVRTIAVVVIIGGMITLYFWLKTPKA